MKPPISPAAPPASDFTAAYEHQIAQGATEIISLHLGRRYSDGSAGEVLIAQLVGINVERMALGAMDPNAAYGVNGQTVQDRMAEQWIGTMKMSVARSTRGFSKQSPAPIANRKNMAAISAPRNVDLNIERLLKTSNNRRHLQNQSKSNGHYIRAVDIADGTNPMAILALSKLIANPIHQGDRPRNDQAKI
jgi:hypothetical protein